MTLNLLGSVLIASLDRGSFTDKSEGTEFISGEGCEKERRMNPEGAGAAAILAPVNPD